MYGKTVNDDCINSNIKDTKFISRYWEKYWNLKEIYYAKNERNIMDWVAYYIQPPEDILW